MSPGKVTPGEVRQDGAPWPADCPPAEPLRDTTGWEMTSGRYQAFQSGGVVRIVATGSSPSAGYEVRLVMRPVRIYPPQFALYSKAPEGMAAQVITPFEICTQFNAGEPVAEVTVFDADGRHQVEVVQVAIQ